MSVTVALDTSTALTCVGLVTDSGFEAELFDVPASGDRPGHASKALALIQDLLNQSGSRWDDIETVVVGVGPGSFTGLRVGLATAFGIGVGSGAELKGVSGLTALLHGLGGAENAMALIDARRHELFAASSFEVGSVDRISRSLEDLPLAPRAICVGDGAVLERGRLIELGYEVPDEQSGLHVISALRMIEANEAGLAIEPVAPLYVRGADAVPTAQREGR